MLSLVILFLGVAVVVGFAIYKISRENTRATTSAYEPTSEAVSPGLDPRPDLSHHDLMKNMLQGSDPSDDHGNQKGSLIDGMVPLSTIVAGVEQFKANYRGPNHERIVAMLDQGLAELKSRYGEEIPVHELREFIKAKRQQLFSEFS